MCLNICDTKYRLSSGHRSDHLCLADAVRMLLDVTLTGLVDTVHRVEHDEASDADDLLHREFLVEDEHLERKLVRNGNKRVDLEFARLLVLEGKELANLV